MYKESTGSGMIFWSDVSRTGCKLPNGISQAMALNRFHVTDADGNLLTGGDAFITLWKQLPRFRILGDLCDNRPLRLVVNVLYDCFLKLRQNLQNSVVDEPRS